MMKEYTWFDFTTQRISTMNTIGTTVKSLCEPTTSEHTPTGPLNFGWILKKKNISVIYNSVRTSYKRTTEGFTIRDMLRVTALPWIFSMILSEETSSYMPLQNKSLNDTVETYNKARYIPKKIIYQSRNVSLYILPVLGCTNYKFDLYHIHKLFSIKYIFVYIVIVLKTLLNWTLNIKFKLKQFHPIFTTMQIWFELDHIELCEISFISNDAISIIIYF